MRSPRRPYPVGRLDADTTGLILLTNDGELAERLTHPRYGVDKVYRARVQPGRVSPASLRALREGVELEDGLTAPARVRQPQTGVIEVTIREGRKRQVRRMIEAVGHRVIELERVALARWRCAGWSSGRAAGSRSPRSSGCAGLQSRGPGGCRRKPVGKAPSPPAGTTNSQRTPPGPREPRRPPPSYPPAHPTPSTYPPPAPSLGPGPGAAGDRPSAAARARLAALRPALPRDPRGHDGPGVEAVHRGFLSLRCWQSCHRRTRRPAGYWGAVAPATRRREIRLRRVPERRLAQSAADEAQSAQRRHDRRGERRGRDPRRPPRSSCAR